MRIVDLFDNTKTNLSVHIYFIMTSQRWRNVIYYFCIFVLKLFPPALLQEI